MHPRSEQPDSRIPQLAIVVVLVLCALGSLAVAETDLSDLEVAVEAGAQALDQSPAMPWYDAEADDFRPARVKPPPAPRPARTGNFSLADWMRLLGWLALAALLGLLAYFVIKAYLLGESGEAESIDRVESNSGDIARVDELPVALAAMPDNYLAEARRLYQAGDFAQAIVYLFSHQLLRLDRRHWIRLVKGKTNRQYLREVRRSSAPSASELANLFEKTVLVFEEIFFGKRLPSQHQLDDCWGYVDRFDSLVVQNEGSGQTGEIGQTEEAAA